MTLDVDSIEVESFAPEAEEAEKRSATAKEFSGLSVYRPCFATEAPSCRC